MKAEKVLFLTCNENALELYEWLKERVEVKLWKEKLTLEQVEEWKPDLIVSYNYSYIITPDVITYMNGKILNLHISMLPWNRGASPNIWSFLDDTPKGVTIHQMSEQLDKGDIAYQKELSFDIEKETFSSTYDKLHSEIVKLFIKNWNEIAEGKYPKIHQSGNGSYHSVKDLKELEKKCPFSWNDNIAEYLKRYHDIRKNKD